MKIFIVGKDREEVTPFFAEQGFSVVEKGFDFVVSYGGDGTLMKAEEQFPGVPKIVLKNSAICKKCSPFSNEEVLKKIKSGKYITEEMPKLEVIVRDQKLIGMNDIIVHNKDPRHAMRYRISVNGKPVSYEIIGDGIVAATPFGSTAYYRSITDSFFEIGIGLAFNNSTEQSDHMLLSEKSVIELEVTRGPALVYADNQETIIDIDTGEKIRIVRSEHKAKIVVVI
ncbi:MAG: hypothetical protein AAB407_04230 [Patescibacteria group bacterium]